MIVSRAKSGSGDCPTVSQKRDSSRNVEREKCATLTNRFSRHRVVRRYRDA
jgi:hypothetical protein